MKNNFFALNAIASSIFMLHAETASAISCPAQISDTSLAGIICDFDSGTSVTVENSGVVAGINMVSFTPLSSFISLNAGGVVSNSTGIGININNSSLSNGLLNNGTISNTTGAGIIISNTSTISGGLSNSGLISTGSGGITLNQSNINGGLSNSGTIQSTNGTGILLSNSSTITGGISNSGTIQAGSLDVGIGIINHSIVNDAITNNGLIEALGGDGIIVRSLSIINGGISNNGTIKSSAHVGISVLNQSQIIGNITNNGIINGNNEGLSIHNASSVNGNILNNGTINGNNGKGLAIFSSTNISGGISNNGTIRSGGTGIAILSASNVNGGISNSGIIQGDIFAINITPDSNVNHIDIVGQHARMVGAVQAVNAELNITSGTVFTSEGAFNVNNFNIASNAIFNMANTITASNVNNAGILALQNLQNIVGNYTQNSKGLFKTGIINTTHYGQMFVSGTLDLSQSGNIDVSIAENASIHTGDVFNVMSGNTLIAPTNGLNVTDNSFVWKFNVSTLNNTEINLTAAINPQAKLSCQDDYCQGAANTIIGQIAAGNIAFNSYALLPTSNAFTTAVSQATPELTNENIQVTQWITKSVMDIVPMWSRLYAPSISDAMLDQPGKIWVKPYGGSITQNESDSIEGFNTKAYGFVFGKDIQLNEDWLLGSALAIGKDTINGKSTLDTQSIDSNDYQAIVYAAKKFPYHLYFAGQGLVGYGNNTTKRSIPLYASTAKGSYNSWFTNLRTQLGWSYEVMPDFVLTPNIDVSYLFVNQGSYRESGSPMDLGVDSSNNSSLMLSAYGHAAYRLATFKNKQDITLTGYVGVAHNVLNEEPDTTATFVAGGPSFSTFGVPLNEFVFRGGVGLILADPMKPLYMILNYELQTGNNAYSDVGTITIAYNIS